MTTGDRTADGGNRDAVDELCGLVARLEETARRTRGAFRGHIEERADSTEATRSGVEALRAELGEARTQLRRLEQDAVALSGDTEE